MRSAWLACTLLISMSFGCTQITDPCPRGQSLRADHCVRDGVDAETTENGAVGMDATIDDAGRAPVDEDTGQAAMDGGEDDADGVELDAEPEAGELDAEPDTGEPDTGPDGRLDAELEAGELDATAESGPDGETDADLGADAGADADSGEPTEAGSPGALLCTAKDLGEWHDFHLSTQLVFDVGACWASDPSCSGSSCALADCLRERLRISGCEECVAQEVACVAAACAQPCGASHDNQACRACACHGGCISAFDACSGAAGDLCADCDETTCTNQSLLPLELLMVIVEQALLQ